MPAILVYGLVILLGLLFCMFHTHAKGILSTIVYWTGVALIIIGLILLLFPVLAWLHTQISAAVGAK